MVQHPIFTTPDHIIISTNEGFLVKEASSEAKVDTYVQRMRPILQSREKTEAGDILRAPFELYCAEY